MAKTIPLPRPYAVLSALLGGADHFVLEGSNGRVAVRVPRLHAHVSSSVVARSLSSRSEALRVVCEAIEAAARKRMVECEETLCRLRAEILTTENEHGAIAKALGGL